MKVFNVVLKIDSGCEGFVTDMAGVFMKILNVVLQMNSGFESIFTNVAGVDGFSKTDDDRILSDVVVDGSHVEV